MKKHTAETDARASDTLDCHIDEGAKMLAAAHPGALAALYAAEFQASHSGDLPTEYLLEALALAANRERVQFMREGMRAGRKQRSEPVPFTPPVYDEVFDEGTAMLDDDGRAADRRTHEERATDERNERDEWMPPKPSGAADS